MSKTRIYKVTTPTGVRLVESPTKGQAVKHCVDADYGAEVIGAAEAFELRDKGVTVERVTSKDTPVKVAEKKSGTAETAAAPAPSSEPVKATSSADTPSTLPQPAAPSAPTAPPTGHAVPQGNVQGGSFIPPQPVQAQPQSSGSVNPVLAEQQRINPDAAAAAGAPTQKAPVDWEAREKQAQ